MFLPQMVNPKLRIVDLITLLTSKIVRIEIQRIEIVRIEVQQIKKSNAQRTEGGAWRKKPWEWRSNS